MKKVLGICVVAAVAAGAAIFTKKCLEAGCRDDVLYPDDKDFKEPLLTKDVFLNKANKILDGMKATAAEMCASMKESFAKQEAQPPFIPESDVSVDPEIDDYDE